ncbi:MlaE family ABC transporter permease [Legionella impletisoli]|nr:ABC transporter permease [Legionella impletisoli]
MTKTPAQLTFDTEKKRYTCIGDWSIHNMAELQDQIRGIHLPSTSKIEIRGELSQFDSAGALFLFNFITTLKERDNSLTLHHFTQQQQDLLSLVEEKKDILNYTPPPPEQNGLLHDIGVETVHKIDQGQGLVILVGDLSDKLFKAFHHVRRFHFPSIVSTIYNSGVTALPIIGLLSFLIGVVLAYQMGLQLETYGANIFIAYLSGMAIFREFSPLITAIIVAGRTSSAFTAQIGSMKINEEIDALYTMGLSPTELLVLPRVVGLLIVFPLLIFWSVLFSTIGAMIMSKTMLHVGYSDFLSRLQDSVGFKQLELGLYKAPAFAILIAIVGCFQGMCVEANADSVGKQTTKSVVQALFLIIVADAIYSVIYSWLDI